jgi:hypothetical protein
MSDTPQSRSSWSPELALVLLIPLVTLLAGAAMIHVASRFGFTALGEPLPATASVAATRDR